MRGDGSAFPIEITLSPLEQLALLQALACDEAQGFYFSRPLPPDQFVEYLEPRRTG